jgi:adenylate cyclase
MMSRAALDFLTVPGKIEPVGVYEIIAPAGRLSATEQELRGLFVERLAAYRARHWDRSVQRFA